MNKFEFFFIRKELENFAEKTETEIKTRAMSMSGNFEEGG